MIEMPQIWLFILIGSTMVVALLKGLFEFKDWLKKENENVNGCMKMDQKTHDFLYDQNGRLKVVLKDDCKNCHEHICKSIQEVKVAIEVADKKRDQARQELTGELKEIHKFIGKVEYHIKSINGQK